MGKRQAGRKVQGLEWARWTAPPAFAQKPPRLKAPQRAGLAFERKVGRALGHFGPSLYPGRWISYQDRSGPGLAQPDFVLVLAAGVLVLEVKLKFVLSAVPQLDSLYVPLLQHLFPGGPIWRAVLCKHAAPEARRFHTLPATDVELSDLCQDEAQPPVLLWPRTAQAFRGGLLCPGPNSPTKRPNQQN